jgi:hypothetical protein
MIIIMYLKISRIPLLILMLIPSFTWAQRCNDYACVIAKVEKLMKEKEKNYKAILDNLDSAEGYPDSKAEEIRGLRRRVFVLIENEKNEAKKQTKLAKLAEAKSDSLFQIAENQKIIALKQTDSIKIALGRITNIKGHIKIALDNLQSTKDSLNTQKDYGTQILSDVSQFSNPKVKEQYNIQQLKNAQRQYEQIVSAMTQLEDAYSQRVKPTFIDLVKAREQLEIAQQKKDIQDKEREIIEQLEIAQQKKDIQDKERKIIEQLEIAQIKIKNMQDKEREIIKQLEIAQIKIKNMQEDKKRMQEEKENIIQQLKFTQMQIQVEPDTFKIKKQKGKL